MTTTPTNASTRPDRPAIEEMYVVHRVFRRELRTAPDLVRGVPEGDVARAGVVAGHVHLVLAGLHMHHTGEDEVLWPRLLERATPSTELVHTMEAQHARVEAYTAQMEQLLGAWRTQPTALRGEQLARALEDLTRALLEHLELEEREVLSLIAEHITAAEWDSLGEHGRDAMTVAQLPLMFGLLLEDADPQERASMMRSLPLPVRLLLRTVGAWHFRRYISRVRAA